MLNKYARALFGRIFTPIARALVRLGISPDVVTIVGTLGVMAGALLLFPRGEFFWGTMVITAFVFSDIIDGLMARMTERSSTWGAYLDSTLDRFGDAAVFGGLAMWFAGGGDNDLLCALCLYNLAAGSVVSYAKARAEGLGMTANVGIAERSDRLVLILVASGFQGVGVPGVQRAALIILAVASTITLFQRMLMVRKQALAAAANTAAPVATDPGPA
ncbi:CDP-alcohol phosphatidyltransferase family protein [Sporichthya brevicatena]|uniref:Phosphatidylinositol phosphate synthase n=1 Tax=Sporichthya brevicatena TaxID=171442 RepID=A0ABN1H0Q7_9ACTN